jgi:multidrug resistance efflux pump
MAALRNIQDKIRGLEQGRAHAEKNLRLLTEETSRYRDLLEESSINQRDQSIDTTTPQIPNYSLNADSKGGCSELLFPDFKFK